MRGAERLDDSREGVLGDDDLDAVLVDVLLHPHVAERGVGTIAGEEGARAFRVPGAALVIADDAAAGAEDRVTRCVERLLWREPDELDHYSTLSICARCSLPE